MSEAIEFCQKDLGLSGDALVKCIEKFSEHTSSGVVAVLVFVGVAFIGLIGALIFD